MASVSKKSALERRLREIEKERELVRRDIRALSRAVRKPEELQQLPALKSSRMAARSVPPPSRPDPAVKAPSGAAALGAGAQDDLFSAATSRKPAAGPAAMSSHPDASAVAGPVVRGDQRFANYFSSGGFLDARPLKQEQKTQRNKAIFMIIIVAIVAFSVYQLVLK